LGLVTKDDELYELYQKCELDPEWESKHVSLRPLRGPQVEIIKRLEKIVAQHNGDIATVRSARQTGKNETGATLHRRHLFRHQYADRSKIWIRTAPTWKPQIVNSKKRLRELLQLSTTGRIQHPLFNNQKLAKEEGYIWRLGNASVEFISSGPGANVVGGTANECLDMDEAHKIDKDKFDEDFAPMTADTSAATILWGVAADGTDVIQHYHDFNIENKRKDLNLTYPCDIWMDVHAPYRLHVEKRVKALGWDHPIIKTQYRLIPVKSEGKFLQPGHVRALLDSDHPRLLRPQHGRRYEMVIDIAGSNENHEEGVVEGQEDTTTDSSVVFIYEVTPIVCSNGIFPIIRIVNLQWMTGVPLPTQENEIDSLIQFWRPDKVTIDGVGVGRQIAEAMQRKYGEQMVNMYIASDVTVSADCFDLQARLNFKSVLMFQDDQSKEYQEFMRQVGWTKYASKKGKMKLVKPKATEHIDMVKALTYINQNNPAAGMMEIYGVGGDFSA
jgi:hypothetical protein